VVELNVEKWYNEVYHNIVEVKIMKNISYKPLFKMLVDRDISKAQLRDMCGYSTAVATKLNKGEMVSLGVLVAICTALDCNIQDVLTLEPVSE
jgi:DNA-binding Xre family transcriptional regulator